jgi:monoterpene epsilon-lactone hydrolase
VTTPKDPSTQSGREVRRFISPPRSVSEQAQQYLATDMFGGDRGTPDLGDLEGWRTMIKESNELLVAAIGPSVEHLRSAVEARSIGGVPIFDMASDRTSDRGDHPIYLDLHGGGLILGGGEACRVMGLRCFATVQMRTWSVDYRMPPDHPYPAALDDCMAVYAALLEVQRPERIVVGGGSAGGNLAAALVLRARDEGLPLPAALVLLTPEIDLTESGDTFQTNLGIDSVLTSSLADSISLYAAGHDLEEPYLSPLFGDLTPPFPPTFLQSGTRDMFLSNTVRMHRKLRAGGIDAQLHVFEAMPHGGFWDSPEDEELASELRRFVTAHVGT